jgi:hypothetical protein
MSDNYFELAKALVRGQGEQVKRQEEDGTMNTHFHWHIWYMTAAGYKVPDSVPFTSREAALAAIKRMNWAKEEYPEPRKVAAPWCQAGC